MSTLLPVAFQNFNRALDPKAQPPGALEVAENCAMDKARRLVKRMGTKGLAKTLLAGGSVAAGTRLQTRGDDIAIADGESVLSYSGDLTSWQQLWRPLDMRITRRGLIDTTRSVVTCDVALYGNLLITSFLSGSLTLAGSNTTALLYLKIENVDTGALVLPPVLVAGGLGIAWSRIRVSGTSLILMYSEGIHVWLDKFDLVAMDFAHTSPFTKIENAAATNTPVDFDIMTPTGGVPTIFAAWGLFAGTSRLRAQAFLVSDFSAVGPAHDYATTSNPPTTMCVTAQSDLVHIAASVAALQKVKLISLTTVFGALAETLENGLADYASVSVVDATNLLVVLSVHNPSNAQPYALYSYLTSIAAHAQVAISIRETYQIVAHSRPWSMGGRWFTAAVTAPHGAAAIPNVSSVVLEIETSAASLTSVTGSPANHVGTLENDTGWTPALTGYLVPAAVLGSTVYVPAAYRNQEPLSYASIPIGFNLHKLEAGGAFGRALIGRGSLVAGAAPYWHDGASAHPYGFAHAPVITTLTAAPGGAMAAGVYTYVAVYEWRDANGVLHRSIPSPPRSVTVAASGLVTVGVSSSSISQKQGPPYGAGNVNAANPVSIVIYRTTAGGGVYYRLTLEPDFQVLINDPTASEVSTFTLGTWDTKNDADIGNNNPARPLNAEPELYTSSGELDDVPPPSLITCLTHRGRIAGIGPDLRTIWFSKDATQDPAVAPGFNEALTLGFASDKSALASLDDKLAVFGEDTIDVVYGDGPDANGNNNTWQIQRVQCEAGCAQPRSVVTCPVFVMFVSSRGFEQLDRKLNVTWMSDLPAGFPTITSAVVVASQHEIRFTCTSLDGLTGIVLAYDYMHEMWFTRKYKDSSDTAAASIPFVDAALIGGIYTLLTPGGQVYQETSDHKLDGGVDFVTRDVELAWLSPTDKMAWHRVKDVSLLGTSVTDHDLEVSIARDYGATEQTKTFLAQSDATTIGPLERCRVTLKNQKCRAVKLRFRDLVPTAPGVLGTGDGPILEGLALRVMTKDGPAKTSAAEQG